MALTKEAIRKRAKPKIDKNLPEVSDGKLGVFKPTQNQLKWLSAASDPNVKSDISAIAKEAGVNRSQWYVWRKDPSFIEWWEKAWRQIQSEQVWILDKIGWDRAKKDFKYWEAMQIKYGGLKQTVELNNTGNPLSANIFVGDWKDSLRNPEIVTKNKLKPEEDIKDGEVFDLVTGKVVKPRRPYGKTSYKNRPTIDSLVEALEKEPDEVEKVVPIWERGKQLDSVIAGTSHRAIKVGKKTKKPVSRSGK